jgi:hypothetical protein
MMTAYVAKMTWAGEKYWIQEDLRRDSIRE